jgi:hypothetical protein
MAITELVGGSELPGDPRDLFRAGNEPDTIRGEQYEMIASSALHL